MRYRKKTVLSKIFSKNQHKKSNKLTYGIIAFIVLFLLFNSGARNLFKLFNDKRTVTNKLEKARKENELLQERLSKYQSGSGYLERAVRGELGVIGQDEIEYRMKKK
ncbi:MAG: septum formation initiator family protein [Elusimicrobiota bacterium]|jgi:cell division protein FtsB|nr:septum formation initiator family protein [Elusimicrobiota bacterium]